MTAQLEWRKKFEADALKIYTENQQHSMKLEFTSVLHLAEYRPGGASSSFEPCYWGNGCNRGKTCKFLHNPIDALNSLKNRFAEKHLTDAEKKLYEKIVNPIYDLLQDARKNIFRPHQNDSGDDRTEEESRDSRRSIETSPIPVRPDISYSDALTTPHLRAALEESDQDTKVSEKMLNESMIQQELKTVAVMKKPQLEDASLSTSPVSYSPVSFTSGMTMFLPLSSLIGITHDGTAIPLRFGTHIIQGPAGTLQLLGNKWKVVEVSDEDNRTVFFQNGVVSYSP
jgi:hypothetical protein